MFGRGDRFTYLECLDCGSLSLQDAPPLGEYYPPDYYSLADRGAGDHGAGDSSPARRSAMRLMLRSRLAAGAAVAAGRRVGVHAEAWTRLLGGSGLRLDSRILDVGCGDGHRLRTLRRFGFTHVTGIDAHLPREMDDAGGIVLSRKALDALDGPFDLAMFHHSFEHMADPDAVLAHVRRLLAPAGLVVIRVPLAGSWAWRTFGVDWVQLDAPRHLFLYTPAGLGRLAARAGFEVRDTVFDSGPFQFWGSELYRTGTALAGSGSVDGQPPPTASRAQVRAWRSQAKKLNAAGDGDQAAFLLTKGAAPPGPAAGLASPAAPANEPGERR